MTLPLSPAIFTRAFKHPLLACMPLRERERLRPRMVTQQFPRGARVFDTGEPATGLLVVVQGLVKELLPGPPPARILDVVGPEESVGDTGLLEGGVYPAPAYALQDSVLVFVPLAELLEGLRQQSSALTVFARLCSLRASKLGKRLVRVEGSIEQRVAQLFEELLERFGDELEDGTKILPVRFTRGELAGLVGTRVETVIRTLTAWSRAGWVRTTETGFEILQPKQLARLAEGLASPVPQASEAV